ncbi:MAG: hypothetical protein P8Y94_04795 [Acidobacteriota bacterium]
MPVDESCIPLQSREEWQNALKGVPHTFGHTWENSYAMHLTTHLDTFLYSFSSDNVRIVCPIVERKCRGHIDIVKPFGFSGFTSSGNCPDFAHRWKRFARSRGYVCGYLGINPLCDCGPTFNPDEVCQYDTIYVLDMTPTYEQLWANLSTNRRRQLRDWEQISSHLVIDQAPLIDFFLSHYVDFFQRKGAPLFYFFSRDTLSFLFELDNVLLVGAQNSKRIEAVSVFTYTEHVGEYLFNISIPGGRHHATPLLWYGLTFLKSRGIPLLNLGGGSAEFKRRFGVRSLPLNCLKQIYRPNLYQKLCTDLNLDPRVQSGYFPPYQERERRNAETATDPD